MVSPFIEHEFLKLCDSVVDNYKDINVRDNPFKIRAFYFLLIRSARALIFMVYKPNYVKIKELWKQRLLTDAVLWPGKYRDLRKKRNNIDKWQTVTIGPVWLCVKKTHSIYAREEKQSHKACYMWSKSTN